MPLRPSRQPKQPKQPRIPFGDSVLYSFNSWGESGTNYLARGLRPGFATGLSVYVVVNPNSMGSLAVLAWQPFPVSLLSFLKSSGARIAAGGTFEPDAKLSTWLLYTRNA